MDQICHCYSCNVQGSGTNFTSNNEDKQNLTLLVCKRIFESVQMKRTSTGISYDGHPLKHGKICNINQIVNLIDREFSQLFRNNILHKEIRRLPSGIWRIIFTWSGFDIEKLTKGLFDITRKWYYPFFIDYLQNRNNQKRRNWQSDPINKNEREFKKFLLNDLKNHLSEFKYLIGCSRNSYYYDMNNNTQEGNFIFASDNGVFVAVEAIWLNVKQEPNAIRSRKVDRIGVKREAIRYLNGALKKFNGKFITIIGAIFVNDLKSGEVIFEFTNNAAQYLQETNIRRNNNNQVTNNISRNEYQGPVGRHEECYEYSSSESDVGTAILGMAVVAGAAYLLYKAFSSDKDKKEDNNNK